MPRALSIPLLVLIGIASASCADNGAQQQAQAAAEAQAQAQAQAARDDTQCRSYGAEPGSPGYVQCRMNLDNQHAQDLRQRRASYQAQQQAQATAPAQQQAQAAAPAQQQAQAAAEAQAQAQAQAARDDAQCRSYGAEPGSPGYVQCRMNLDTQHAQDLRQRRASWFNFNLGSNCLLINCPN